MNKKDIVTAFVSALSIVAALVAIPVVWFYSSTSQAQVDNFNCFGEKIYEVNERSGHTAVIRLCDKQQRVVCYVIPNEHCLGDCAYTPAISCVKL